MQQFSVGLRFKKLPNGSHLHEFCRFFLHFFHRSEQFDGLGFACRKVLLEISAISEMPSKQHEGINVAPHLAQIRHQPYLSIQIRNRFDRQICAHLRRSAHRGQIFHGHRRCNAHPVTGDRVLAQHRLPRRWIHQLVHQPQTRHGVPCVAHRVSITRRDLGLRELSGKSCAADQQRNGDSGIFQIACRDHHLLCALYQQPGKPNRIRMVLLVRLDQFFRRNLDSQIHHVVAVVLQNNFDKVFSDIMHVALHRRQHDSSALCGVSLLHELLKMIHRSFHRFCGLQHFGDNQFVRVEQPSHFRHPRHQRSGDDVERCCALRSLSFQILDQPVPRSLNDVVGEPLVQRQICRSHLVFLLCCSEMFGDRRNVELIDRRALLLVLLSPVRWSILQHLGTRIFRIYLFRWMLEQKIFRKLPLMFRNRRKPFELLRIHNRQIESCFGAVVQKNRIHHLARARRQSKRNV